MMKKIYWFLFFIFVVLIAAYGYSGYSLICPPPEKAATLPEKVIWRGSCDGGEWIEFVSFDAEQKKYHFRIYEGFSGQIMLDANFIEGKRTQCRIDTSDILDEIERFAIHPDFGGQLHFNKGCFLQALYPDRKGKFKDDSYD